jgi:glycosyltransferase involved in cell wall biosynthesis
LIRCADKITAVNDAIAEEMGRRYKVKIDEVILNCPPYESNFSSKADRTIRSRFNIDEETPIYLYSGGLVKQRGIENTILALKYLEKGVLVILGEGQLKNKLIELIKREHLEGRVFFSKFVPHTEVPKFISSADVGILPYENVGINHYLCSPSKLFHYIMAELPVVCSDFPFLRKVVLGNGLGTTFNPADPVSIAEAIRFIVSNKARYQEIKKNLLKAKKRYCWEKEEKKLLKVYNDLNASPKEGGK